MQFVAVKAKIWWNNKGSSFLNTVYVTLGWALLQVLLTYWPSRLNALSVNWAGHPAEWDGLLALLDLTLAGLKAQMMRLSLTLLSVWKSDSCTRLSLEIRPLMHRRGSGNAFPVSWLLNPGNLIFIDHNAAINTETYQP